MKRSLQISVLLVGMVVMAGAPAWAAYRDAVLAHNPVGYWEFEGNLNDSSGNANTLTAFGDAGLSPAYSGRIGGAGTLYRGAADLFTTRATAGFYVDTPEGNALNFKGSAFTINLWVSNAKSTDMTSGTQILVNKRHSTTWYDKTAGGYWNDYGLWMQRDSAGGTNYHQIVGPMWNGSLNYVPGSNLPLPAGEAHVWHMATVAWNGTTEYYYWDGQPVGSAAAAVLLTNSTYRLILGNDDSPGTMDAGDNGLVGMIDEVAIFTNYLSAADVAALYAAAPPVTIRAFGEEVLERNPVGYWKFEGNGTDSSGKGNTLTANASAGYASASPAPGVYRQAALLGASSTDSFYVNTPAGSSLNISGSNWTANLWFKVDKNAPDLSPDRTQVLFAKKRSTAAAWPWVDYCLFLGSWGTPAAYNLAAYMDSAAGAGFNTAETRAITSNEWHMVTCSYMPDTTPGTGPSGNMTLYLDGKWLGTLDVYATLPLTTEHRFIVGNSGAEGDTGYGGNHLGGMIDEVAVFDTALTGWDVYKLYTAAQIPPPKGTVVLIR